jgi:hypothetical protein
MTTLAQLISSTASEQSQPPSEWTPELQTLWLAKRGDWHGAHTIAQDIDSADGSWLHAYLHRLEGDRGNAAYWYHRANRPMPDEDVSSEEEWQVLASYFCTKNSV